MTASESHPNAPKRGETAAEYRSRILAEVSAIANSAESFAELQRALALLPPGPERLILMLALAPEASPDVFASSDVPEDEQRAYLTLSSKLRLYASDEQRDELRGRVAALARADVPSFDIHFDPLTHTRARTVLDVLNGDLQIRVIGSRTPRGVDIDFTKSADDALSFAEDLVRWVAEAVQETIDLGLDPSRFVNQAGVTLNLARIEEHIRKLRDWSVGTSE